MTQTDMQYLETTLLVTLRRMCNV